MSDQTVTEAVVTQITQDIHSTNLEKGFWEPPDPFLAEICVKLNLVHAEVSEATEVLREAYDGEVNPFTRMTQAQGEEFIEELADIVIRTFDLAQYFAGALPAVGQVILQKMSKNRGRPHRHGKRF